MRRIRPFLLLLLLLLLGAQPLLAQDLEPRRWLQIPVGTTILTATTTLLNGDVYLDPVLEIENGQVEQYGLNINYLRTFDVMGRTTRLDVRVPYAMGRWDGLQSGDVISTRRHGFGDPMIRLSMLLKGGPALTVKELLEQGLADNILGASIAVMPPLGEYSPERLINLGSNRWTIRPQLGFQHRHGRWVTEITGSFYWYSDNKEYNGSNRLYNDARMAVQAHAIYHLNPGLWFTASAAYGWRGEAEVNGQNLDNPVGNMMYGLGLGKALSRHHGFNIRFDRSETRKSTGSDTNALHLTYTFTL